MIRLKGGLLGALDHDTLALAARASYEVRLLLVTEGKSLPRRLVPALVADKQQISTYEIDKRDWGEIDFHPDIENVKAAISKALF